MKKIKFEHDLASLIRSGQKVSTWRIYDDKALAVNDEIAIIDKVDPSNPETWLAIDTAIIDQVTEKRLGDITSADYDDQHHYKSNDELVTTYRQYYGPEVDQNTIVKIIHFRLNMKNSHTVAKKSTKNYKEVKMYSDGGSRGNPGPSASGYILLTMDGELIDHGGEYLGITTNNQAEYQGLKSGLEAALRVGAKSVHVYMDSMLVVNQMKGIFSVKNRDLWPIHGLTKELADQFSIITFTHVPRELNRRADKEVNDILDLHHSNKS
jgi:ribonuclease HI